MAIVIWEVKGKDGELTSPLSNKTYELLSGLETNMDDADARFFFAYGLDRDKITDNDIQFIYIPRIYYNSNGIRLSVKEWRAIKFLELGVTKKKRKPGYDYSTEGTLSEIR